MTTEKPTRRWYQFSLRTLLVFMLLCSIGMSWFAVKLQQVRKQREIVEVLRELRGGVSYDYQFDPFSGQPGKPGKPPPQPAWLLELLGIDFFADVTHVLCREPTDAGLVHLKGLTKLKGLYLSDTPVTDAGLEHLKGLTKLKWLDLSDTPVTDAGLVHLKGLTKLKHLYLFHTGVTDEGVIKLQQALPNCKIQY